MPKTSSSIKSAVLGFTIILLLLHVPLAGRKHRGAIVEVTLREDRVVRGELLAVKADSLLIYCDATDQGTGIKLDQVKRVQVIKKSKGLMGLAVGVGAALVISAITYNSYEKIELNGIQFLMLPPLFGLVGFISGAAAGQDKKYTLYTASPEQQDLILKKLGRYAREK